MNLCESWPRNAFTDIISLDAVVLRRETRRPIGFGMYRLGFSCRKIAQCWDATVEQKYANVVQCIAVTMTALSAQVVGLPIAQLLQSSFNTSLTRCTAQKSPTFNVCYILWLWLLNIDTRPHITLKSTCVKVLTPVGPFLVGLVAELLSEKLKHPQHRLSSGVFLLQVQRPLLLNAKSPRSQDPKKSHRTSFQGFQGDLGRLISRGFLPGNGEIQQCRICTTDTAHKMWMLHGIGRKDSMLWRTASDNMLELTGLTQIDQPASDILWNKALHLGPVQLAGRFPLGLVTIDGIVAKSRNVENPNNSAKETCARKFSANGRAYNRCYLGLRSTQENHEQFKAEMRWALTLVFSLGLKIGIVSFNAGAKG